MVAKPKVVAIIQARTGSTRLPGKVLKELFAGKTLLQVMLERISPARGVDEFVVAVPDSPSDSMLAGHVRELGYKCILGDEHDVLDRFVQAAKQAQADIVVRLCADSPLHDSEIISTGVDLMTTHLDAADYVSNLTPETFPYGTAVEVMPVDVLLRTARLAKKAFDREHVTPFIREHDDLFRCLNFVHSTDFSRIRWAVDTAEDFEFVRTVFAKLYPSNPRFSWLDAVGVTSQLAAH